MQALLFGAVSMLAATAWSAAVDLGSAKVVGASCDKPFLVMSTSADGSVSENHSLDGRWVHLQITSTPTGDGTTHYVVSWSLAPGVKLCDSLAKLGDNPLTALSAVRGTISADASAAAPVLVKIRGRVGAPVRLRPLGPVQRRALITGWARRGCALRSSNAPAAGLLADLANRAHAHDCHGPGHSAIPAAASLLHHVSAYFNTYPTSDAQARVRMGLEYYRVLRQLTAGFPALPAPAAGPSA